GRAASDTGAAAPAGARSIPSGSRAGAPWCRHSWRRAKRHRTSSWQRQTLLQRRGDERRPGQVQRAAKLLYHQTLAVVTGHRSQRRQRAPRRVAAQHPRLIVDARVAVLDVERVDEDLRVLAREPEPDEKALGLAVARPEGEVAEAVEDRPAAVDFEG